MRVTATAGSSVAAAIISMSSGAIVPTRSSEPAMKPVSGSQNSVPIAMIGKRSILPVWIRVMVSKVSSRVPKPPGMTTKAQENLSNMTLRTKKWSNSTKRSR
jgi:hypothetical protein